MGDRRGSLESHGEPDVPPPAYAAFSSPLVPQHGFGPADAAQQSRQHIQHPAFDHAFAHLNLPRGYFLLRNTAQGKTLDLLGHKQHEGAELGLHPIKQPQLQGLSLQHKQNNQLFFLDWDVRPFPSTYLVCHAHSAFHRAILCRRLLAGQSRSKASAALRLSASAN